MSFINRTALLTLYVVTLPLLVGCIGSPFPGGTVGALYRWDDLATPALTVTGEENDTQRGYFDGDFDLTALPRTHPELESPPGSPWLFEACGETQCQSLVLFAEDFEFDPIGRLSGSVSMNVMTTLMANEVRGMPAASVRARLDALAERLTFDGVADYAAFIGRDLRRDVVSREALLYPELYDEAELLISGDGTATVSDLLGQEVARTDDLAAPADFGFDSSWSLGVDVDLAPLRESGAYLLLCRDFDLRDGNLEVNYASCPLKAPLQEGRWLGEIQLTESVNTLAAVVLPLENPNDPMVTVWERSIDGDLLLVR